MIRGYQCLVDDAHYHGYVAALSGFGIAVDEHLNGRGDFRFQPTVTVAEEILRRSSPPTAVFAANDLGALGVMKAARRIGLCVPSDLSVVGFDDSIYASAPSPQLTTVRQPFAQMGEVAYQLLADQMEGRIRPLFESNWPQRWSLVIPQHNFEGPATNQCLQRASLSILFSLSLG